MRWKLESIIKSESKGKPTLSGPSQKTRQKQLWLTCSIVSMASTETDLSRGLKFSRVIRTKSALRSAFILSFWGAKRRRILSYARFFKSSILKVQSSDKVQSSIPLFQRGVSPKARQGVVLCFKEGNYPVNLRLTSLRRRGIISPSNCGSRTPANFFSNKLRDPSLCSGWQRGSVILRSEATKNLSRMRGFLLRDFHRDVSRNN